MATGNSRRQLLVLGQELKAIEKQEGQLRRAATRKASGNWKQRIGDRIPEKVYENLQKAFCTAFQIIFEKGTGVIELSYNRGAIQEGQQQRHQEFQEKAKGKILKQGGKSAASADLRNMAITTVEGVGLGLVGVGLPDIVLFVGMVLRGVYEVALQYGYNYDTPEERWFILKLMETAMLRGSDWERSESLVNTVIGLGGPSLDRAEELKNQIRRTADCLAMDMLVLKFIQGTPVVGVVGGLGNPVYYRKILKYVQVKYRKRYLIDLKRKARAG